MWWKTLLFIHLPLLVSICSLVQAQTRHLISDDSDLFAYISRPDLKPPRFIVNRVKESPAVASGYWFLAPYEGHAREEIGSTLYKPAQVGPHIYDGAGELVWSGAHLFRDASTFDFKTSSYRGSPGMSFILKANRFRENHPEGAGVILDSSFKIENVVVQASGNHVANMHEFTVTKADTALMIAVDVKYESVVWGPRRESEDEQKRPVWIADNGFREMNLLTGQTIFEWWALDHVKPAESFTEPPTMPSVAHKPWDWFHLNSIDKNSQGDYLISSRFLNSIYKISGKDGSILWQLGGRNSSFTFPDGFEFSRQHDARFRLENSTHNIISFLNNAADDDTSTADVSSAFTMLLDLQSMSASLLNKLDRPDKKLSRLRGNVQFLPNGNTFVCWSENSRISEFDPKGNLLLEAAFASHRFVTYRAFKFDFNSHPSEPIALKAFVYGVSLEKGGSVTALYTSWNGATEVVSWRFYGSQGVSNFTLLGETAKTGFETALMVQGCWSKVRVEGFAQNGQVLGTSDVHDSILPTHWTAGTCGEALPVGHSQNHFNETTTPKLTGDETVIPMTTRLLLGCIFILVLLLCLAAWKLRHPSLPPKDRSEYIYTSLNR